MVARPEPKGPVKQSKNSNSDVCRSGILGLRFTEIEDLDRPNKIEFYRSVCYLFKRSGTVEPQSMVFDNCPQRGARERSSY